MVEVAGRHLQAASALSCRWGCAVVRHEEVFSTLRWASIPCALTALPGTPLPWAHPVATLRIVLPNVATYRQAAQQAEGHARALAARTSGV